MKITALIAPLVLVASGAAQEEASGKRPSAAARLQAQLRTAAAVTSAEFDVNWQWPITVRGSATTSRSRSAAKEHVQGRFYRDAVFFEVKKAKLGTAEVLQVGRHTMARENKGAWQLDALTKPRAIRVTFLPDPQRLLLALAAVAPTVSNRDIIDVDGRAVERVGMTLNSEQVGLLVRAGVLHEPNPMSGFLLMARAQGAAPKDAGAADAVDVVIEVDVETKHVHAVRIRATVAVIDMGAVMQRMRQQRPGGRRQQKDHEEEPEPKKPKKAKKVDAGPVRYEGGMPVRDTTDKSVLTFELKMRKHGQLPAFELSDEQKKLLGR